MKVAEEQNIVVSLSKKEAGLLRDALYLAADVGPEDMNLAHFIADLDSELSSHCA